MAKSRRNRGGSNHRRDPVAKPVKPPSDPELAALRESKILPILRDLQAADPKSRSAAASVISSIIQDSRCRKLLLREQIVNVVLTQTLTDAALESRAAGWGILQVLADEEEADFCVHLHRQDILTAIEFASKLVSDKLHSQETPFSKIPKAERAFTSSIASSLVSLLSALAEAGDDILESISANPAITHLLSTLVSYTNSNDDDSVTPVRSHALACLMILCEDNADLARKIASADHGACYKTLLALKDETSGDGVLACAVLHGLYAALASSSKSPPSDIVDDSELIPTLTKALSTFTPGLAVANGGGWSSPVEYQQLALETLASIGTSISLLMGEPVPTGKKGKRAPAAARDEVDDDADEDMGDVVGDGLSEDEDDAEEGDGEGEDEGSEMDDDEMEADMDMVLGGEHVVDNIDDLPALKALLQLALPELIRIASLQPSDDVSMRFQGHALSALNNIAWSVSLVDFTVEQNAGVQNAWVPIGRAIWQQVITSILSSDTADVDLATQVTSLAWATARTLRGETPLQPNEHRKFISLYQATKGAPAAQDPEDPFQALGVKCVGVLGQLALHPAPVDLNRDIGTFLVTLAAGLPETPAADSVEALNQLLDVYGNEEYGYDAEVFWKDGFLKHLEDAVPKARAMAKSINKTAQPELRIRADEVVLNLNRFLAYKKKHKP